MLVFYHLRFWLDGSRSKPKIARDPSKWGMSGAADPSLGRLGQNFSQVEVRACRYRRTCRYVAAEQCAEPPAGPRVGRRYVLMYVPSKQRAWNAPAHSIPSVCYSSSTHKKLFWLCRQWVNTKTLLLCLSSPSRIFPLFARMSGLSFKWVLFRSRHKTLGMPRREPPTFL